MARNLILALSAVLLCAPIAACETFPSSTVSESLKDEKALYAAEAAYYGATVSAEAAFDAGVLHGRQAVAVADGLQVAYDALLVARQAQAAGNASSAEEASARALAAVAGVYALIQQVKS